MDSNYEADVNATMIAVVMKVGNALIIHGYFQIVLTLSSVRY